MKRKKAVRKKITGFRREHQDEDDRRRKSFVLKRLVMSGTQDSGTRREWPIVFDGCYHHEVLLLLVLDDEKDVTDFSALHFLSQD